MFQGKTQLFGAAQIELIEDALQMGFYRLWRDDEHFCNLIVPITKADQRHNLLFAMGERRPAFLQFILRPELI